MNDKKNLQPLNENDLSDVSGGWNEQLHAARHSVGQTVRFAFTDGNTRETLVSYTWLGTIVEIIHEPEGVFYKVEVEEQARQILGSSYKIIFIDDVID